MRVVWKQPVCLMIAVASLMAADPAWKSKPAAQWNAEDTQQILASSPWTKEVKAVVTRRLTEEELREGGQMGQPTGVGNEGVDPKGSGPKVSANVFTGAGGDDRSPRSLPRPIVLKLRWESALPIQIAEFNSHGAETPALDGEGYRIAVFGIPGGGFKGDPKELGKPLKNLAALKRDGKKDVRPVSAAVYQTADGVVVEYLFPLSSEISKKDGQIRFEAQIGRIVVSQTFVLSEMEFLGKLEI
jgi:hypothetical protein